MKRLCALPRQLPEGEDNSEFVVELLKLIKSAENKLRLILAFPHDPHHIRLHRKNREGDSSKVSVLLQFASTDMLEHQTNAAQ